MPKLKILSGQEIIKIFVSFGFVVAAQKGSHIKLVRVTAENNRQTLVIPNHDILDKGTVKAIYRQASRYVSESELKNNFYTE